MKGRTFTTRFVENVKPTAKRQEIVDAYLPNFYLVVQPLPFGTKSWAIRYRHGGRNRKHTLGGYPAVDLKAARDLAQASLRAVAEGRDPGQEKARARAASPDTVEAVAERFMEQYCRRRNRPGTIRNRQQMLDTYILPRWRRRLLRDISRRDVRDLVESIAATGKLAIPNAVLELLIRMFNWAIEQEIVAASPCVGVRKPCVRRSRDRVLDDAELRNVWTAAGKLGTAYGLVIKLLMLTGQRYGEVVNMQWGEIDLSNAVWKLPANRTKNGKAHAVPLSHPVIDILTSLSVGGNGTSERRNRRVYASRTLPRTNDSYVFPTINYPVQKRHLSKLLPTNMPQWTPHDLRRSLATGFQRLGVRFEVTEAVLNHVGGSRAGIVGVYQRHAWDDEKRQALDAWASHILAEPAANVVPLRA